MYGSREQLESEYLSRLYRLNEWHYYKSEEKLFKGIVKGISASGKLKLDKENGTSLEFDFKEVEYIR